LIPKEMTADIIGYMGDAFQRSHVKVEPSSSKKLEISIDKAEMNPGGLFGARGGAIDLQVQAPAIGLIKVYSAQEWSAQAGWTTMAYAIHLATWKMIDDPVIQDYVLCGDGRVVKGP
jgi:hypothetical protein